MIDLSRFVKTLNGKKAAVFGLGKSGLSTIDVLSQAGVSLLIGDDDCEKIAPLCGKNIAALDPDFSNLNECAILILGPGVPLNYPAPHPVVTAAQKYGVEVIGDIEIFGRAKTEHRTIGITGTNGKSTTTALIAHILNACGIPAIACGNIGTPILSTTPMPHTTYVIEMSSFQIDLCPTFRPDISLHLNITPDHIDRHGTIENYIAIKERLLEGPGIGLCGVDDAASAGIYARTVAQNPSRRMIPVSVGSPQDHGITVTVDGLLLDRAFSSENSLSIDLSVLPTLRGAHNYQNAAMAFGAARACGCAVSDIMAAMQTYPGLPHRQLRVTTIGQVDYINDSKATNADATEKALKTFSNIHWIVGGKQKDGGLSGLEPYASRIARAYLIGSSSDDFARFMDAHHIPYERSGTLDMAVQAAHQNAQKSEGTATVLLSPACASYDQFKSYEHRGDVFTDLVQQLIPKDRAEKCA